MHNNNSELIAFGLSVNFNWPPEECNCLFLFSLELHWHLQFSRSANLFFFIYIHQIKIKLVGSAHLNFLKQSKNTLLIQSLTPIYKARVSLYELKWFKHVYPLCFNTNTRPVAYLAVTAMENLPKCIFENINKV